MKIFCQIPSILFILSFILVVLIVISTLNYKEKFDTDSNSFLKNDYDDISINLLTEMEIDQGWILLFDGETFDNWKVYNSESTFENSGWYINCGNLVNKGKGKDLISEQQFDNFELKIDWKICEDSNSGILYRVKEGEKYSFLTGIEYQIIDDYYYRRKINNTQKSGACHDLFPINNSLVNPIGYYNRSIIIVNNNYVEHWLNEVLMTSFNIGDEKWNSLVRNQYGKSRELGKNTKGHIALQVYKNSKVYFRNIKIREISD